MVMRFTKFQVVSTQKTLPATIHYLPARSAKCKVPWGSTISSRAWDRDEVELRFVAAVRRLRVPSLTRESSDSISFTATRLRSDNKKDQNIHYHCKFSTNALKTLNKSPVAI